MVYNFRTRCGEYLLYMGRDKHENEDLIKYGHPEDVWFHVDDLSSAHVYLRLKPGQTMDDIPTNVLDDCGALVKANSIQGCKLSSVYVIYTRWKNLKKNAAGPVGAVCFHRPDNVRRFQVHKDNAVVKALEKTRVERSNPDLYREQQDRLREIQLEMKQEQRNKEKEERRRVAEMRREAEERSYDRIMDRNQMTSVSDMKGTADAAAAEEYEDDFF